MDTDRPMKNMSTRFNKIILRDVNAAAKGECFTRTSSIKSPQQADFLLDTSTIFNLLGPSSEDDNFPRWQYVQYCDDKRIALVMVAGDRLRPTNVINLDRDSILFIRFIAGLPVISNYGLILEVRFIPSPGPTVPLVYLPLLGGRQSTVWHQIEMDLSYLHDKTGTFEISVVPGLQGETSADCVAIADMCISRADRLPIVKASSHHQMRANNEKKNFSSQYRLDMYTKNNDNSLRSNIPIIRQLRSNSASPSVIAAEEKAIDIATLPEESTHEYVYRLLSMRLPLPIPDFLGRLKARVSKGRKIRVLSICSGAARIEASYAAQVGDSVEWSLFDINSDLLTIAAHKFPSNVKLELIEGDVNKICQTNEKWDVILCISALHHIVELERVIRFCYESLEDEGEFWSIGEYIGRNGNRLWPEARAAANEIFSKLPKSKRRNKHTNNVDNEIPDNDYSVGTFEGIRSEDIESRIAMWFQAEEIMKRNCFLWRLTNHTYADNYDLSCKKDRELLGQMVNAEVEHFLVGGQGTELFAVYRPLKRKLTNETKSPAVAMPIRAAGTEDSQFLTGTCIVCGRQTRFLYADPSVWRESLNCSHCLTTSRYRSIARGLLQAIGELRDLHSSSLKDLPRGSLDTLRVYDTQPPFYYQPCAYPLPDLLKVTGWIDVSLSQYCPTLSAGAALGSGITNQNLESLTFADDSYDIIVTSDVMEHVRLDERAHQEIHRVLKPGGIYLFTVPHDRSRAETLVRVKVDPDEPTMDVHLLEPEYHGDVNSETGEGSLAYRVYGRDLDEFLSGIGFDVHYSSEDIPEAGIMSTELFYCRKRKTSQ